MAESAAAPSLQRSLETFRRSGSSGLVWEDRFAPEDRRNNRAKRREEGGEFGELRHSRSVGTSAEQPERSPPHGGGRPYRTGRVSPAVDPPSPRVSFCGLCGIFGKTTEGAAAPAKQPKPRRTK